MKQIILIFYIIPILVTGQIQVSEIEYLLPRDDFAMKGFIKVDDEEYFIEQGIEGTKVSKIKDGGLEFLHTLKHRPGDSFFSHYSYSFESSNSGLIYRGSVLYELYSEYIYGVDIISGELVEKINLKEYNIQFEKDFYQGEKFYHFRAIGDGWSGYVRLDKSSGELTDLKENGIVVGSRRYWTSTNGQSLFYIDLETNQVYEFPQQFNGINLIEKNRSDSSTQLIIRDNSGIYQLKDDGSLYTISCQIQDDDDLLYLSETKLGYTNDSEFKLIDLSDCSEVFSLTSEQASSIQVYTNRELFNEYFFYRVPNNNQGIDIIYLYNFEENTSTQLDFSFKLPILNQAIRYDTYLYFINEIFLIGAMPELYRLDLDNGDVIRISNEEIFTTWDIVIGEKKNDEEINIYFRIDTTASLNLYNVQEAQLSKISDFDLYQNHGIRNSIYADLWAKDKYFFSTTEAIFCTHEDNTYKILDIGPNVHGTSAYIRKDDYVYVLTALNTAHYAIKIDIDDLSFSKILIPELEYLYYKIATSENAIVNLHHSFTYIGSYGFFDVDLEKFITIESLGLPLGTPEFLSGNNILYQTTSNDGYEWYLINTKTQEIVLTDIKPGTFPDPYPDGEGGFYLNGWGLDDQVNFMHLKSDGTIKVVYFIFDHSIFYGGDRFQGEVKSLAFDGEEEMIFISIMDGQVKQKKIPDDGLLYYQNFFWYESDNISFVELGNGSTYDTYMFSFDTEPQKITTDGRQERLIGVLEEEEFSVLLYKDESHKITFEKYVYSNGQSSVINEIQSVRNHSIGSSSMKIDSSWYFLSIDDSVLGQEPWLINTNSGELKLLEDVRLGFQSSVVNDLTRDPTTSEIYFSAIKTKGDRQLFRFNKGSLNIDEIEIVNELDLIIYPNPTSKFITIEGNYKEVLIFGIDGELVLDNSFSSNERIRIDNLPNGIYFALGKTQNNYWHSGKFCIQKL